MRLLHTADWHVGKSIRGRSRLDDEFAPVLDEVVGIAEQEGVDAVLLAGDVYEQRAPAPEADALVFETLVRLHELQIPVVMIPGNHDSAVRFAALGTLLRAIGVTVVARVAPPTAGGIVEVGARDGSHAALVACVPFVPERRFGDAAALFDATESWYQSYAEGMGQILGAMARAFRDDRVNVVLGHLFTDGALLGGGEREITTGMAYAISPGRLPGTANYVALGHVHRPQAVRGAPALTRYAGSLLQLDFGEAQQSKSVTIVDAEPGKPAATSVVELSAGRELLDVRGTLDEVLQRAGEAPDAYLRVFVVVDGPVPGIADRIRQVAPNALDVHLEYERDEVGPHEGAPLSALAPREQFVSSYTAYHGVAPDVSILEAFDEVATSEMETS
ncbi:MAG: exonuclease SbcCD subunit D [Actinomycetota bacterium]